MQSCLVYTDKVLPLHFVSNLDVYVVVFELDDLHLILVRNETNNMLLIIIHRCFGKIFQLIQNLNSMTFGIDEVDSYKTQLNKD